jgi:hypothetical protein
MVQCPATVLWAGHFSLNKMIRQIFEVHLSAYSVGTGIRWPVREAEHSPLSNAKVENEWSSSSVSRLCLHGMSRDSFYSCIIALVLDMGNVCWVYIAYLEYALCAVLQN